MIGLLTTNEFRLKARDPRAVVGLWVCVMLLCSSIVLMIEHNRGLAMELQAEARERSEWIEGLRRMSPDEQYDAVMDHRERIYDVWKVNPLSAFSMGVVPAVPRSVQGDGQESTWVSLAEFEGSRLARLSAPFDFSHLVTFVLSLFAVVLTFDGVAGPRETGVLELVLSNSVSKAEILVSKGIATAVILSLPVVAAVSLGAVVLYMQGGVGLTDLSGRAFLLSVTSVLYGMAFAGLGLCVSARAARPATALVVTLVLWALLTLVLPRVTSMAAQLIHPVPGAGWVAEREERIRRETTHRIIRGAVESASPADKQEERERLLRLQESEMMDLERHYLGLRSRQYGLAWVLSRVSPAACFRAVSSELAGTGMAMYAAHQAATLRFWRETENYLDRLRRLPVYRLPEGGPLAGPPERLPMEEWFREADLPALERRAVATAYPEVIADLGSLALFAVGSLLLGFFFFIRAPVRAA